MTAVKSFVREHWAIILVLGVITGVLLICAAPDYTWINTDSDGIHYTYAAKYLVASHKTSAPLFLLLEHLFLKLPLGTEFHRMAMLLVLSTVIGSAFVYLSVVEHLKQSKPQVNRKLYGALGALLYGTSALVIAESTIVDSYALVTMFGLGAYYFFIMRRYWLCSVMLGCGIAVHLLGWIPVVVLFLARKEFRCYEYFGVVMSFLLFYLYIPISAAVHPEFLNMWGNLAPGDFIKDTLSTIFFLGGGIVIWDFPKRVLDTVGVLGVSLGLALIPVIYFFVKRKWYREPLCWLFIIPVIAYATNLAPQTYVYLMPAIGTGAIIAGIALPRLPKPKVKYLVAGCAIILVGFNAHYFDIGTTLDPNLSASEFYYWELDKVPDGQILVAQQGWEWACVPKYNVDNNRSIIPVCIATLPSPTYQKQIQAQGVRINTNVSQEETAQYSTNLALSIVALNENVWITKPTTPETYGAEIVPAKGNESLLGWTSKGVLANKWKWKPSNPYNIITGAIEVEEWRDIVVSNYNVMLFVMLGVIGGVPAWIAYMLYTKRRWKLGSIELPLRIAKTQEVDCNEHQNKA